MSDSAGVEVVVSRAPNGKDALGIGNRALEQQYYCDRTTSKRFLSMAAQLDSTRIALGGYWSHGTDWACGGTCRCLGAIVTQECNYLIINAATNTQHSPFPETKASIDSVCSNSQNMTACRQACEPAKCCGASMNERDSCLANYPDACLAYTSCHAVFMTTTILTTTTAAPPNLHTICSWENKSACRKACQAAECCWSTDDSSCVSDKLFQCLDYAPCQVLKETNSLYPADTSQLLQVCTLEDNVNDECQDQCDKASCCWKEQGEDCFPTNLVACWTYAPCPQFKRVPPPYSRVDPPRIDLQQVCGVDSILTSEGFQACSVECKEASCCTAAREPYNCFHEDPLGCLQYESCSLLDQAGGSVPRAPDSIQERCRDFQTLGIDDLQWCMDSCQRGACCFATNEDNCFEDGNQLACEEYTVCQPLLQATQTRTTLPRPPVQLQVCTPDNLQTVAGWNQCAEHLSTGCMLQFVGR